MELFTLRLRIKGDQTLVLGIIGKYVFPYCWFSFHFNVVFFTHAEPKDPVIFILMRSHLFILSFMPFSLGDVSVRMLLCGMSEIFLPMFSSRTRKTLFYGVTTYI